jgi:hypothetical protein
MLGVLWGLLVEALVVLVVVVGWAGIRWLR